MSIQYQQQNAKGYEGDSFIHNELKQLIDKHNVKTIVETGSYHGFTTLRLAEFGLKTLTVEADPNNYRIASKNIGNKAHVHFGDSVKFLNHIVKTLEGTTLFYLDAHWGDVCPLLQELKELEALAEKPIIVIHDFKVPGKDFGFDSYNGQEYTLDWITEGLNAVYGAFKKPYSFSFHYNEQADGAKRGVIYIYPEIQAPEVIKKKRGRPAKIK